MTDTQTRGRAFRRYKADSHMWRRLTEDRNQHYNDLRCPCWSSQKAMAKFKEQPAVCSGPCCGNPRRWGKSRTERLTMQELRAE